MTKTKTKAIESNDELLAKTLDHLWQTFYFYSNIDLDTLTPKSRGLLIGMGDRILNEIDAIKWVQNKEGFE